MNDWLRDYYKVKVYGGIYPVKELDNFVIVTKNVLYAREIVTGTRIMICDNASQGSYHNYYVLSSDLRKKDDKGNIMMEHIALDYEVLDYINNFDFDKFPIQHSRFGERKIKKRLLTKQGRNVDMNNIY